MKRFTNDIIDIKRGETDINKVYRGENLVWERIAPGSFFTDSFGIPDVAYSLRKLSPNSVYSGSCIEVRRSSDNTTQDIGFDDLGNLDTTALLNFVGAGNGFVRTWYDQSGNNKHVSNFTGGGTNQDNSRQPSIVSSGNLITFNGKITIDFPNYHFLSSNQIVISPNNDAWAFFVGKANLTSTLNTLFGLAPNAVRASIGATIRKSNLNHYNAPGDFNDFTHGNMNSDCTSGLTPNGLFYYNSNLLPADRNVFNYHFISVRKGTTDNPECMQDTGLTLGSQFEGARNWRGFMFELIMYDSDKDSQRVDIETDLNDYYEVI